MPKQLSREKLNQVTHSVRAAQAVLQYGVGAMVDFPDQTLITAAPEYWSQTQRISDERFAKALGVDGFITPVKIAYNRFPEWYFCPKCRTFQPLKQWVSEYKKYARDRDIQFDPHMISHIKCTRCRYDLVAARIVTVCEEGHLNDFPWVQWVHARAKKPLCASPAIKLKTGPSGSEALDGLIVSCNCGAWANLSGAFNPGVFERLDAESDTNDFRCTGGNPHKNIHEKCVCYPRAAQRRASSVYFPIIKSSLVIPPYADKLYAQIEGSEAYCDCLKFIADEEPEDRIAYTTKKLAKWSEKIALEIGGVSSDIERILRRKWLEDGEAEAEGEVSDIAYRIKEYAALTGEIAASWDKESDFLREGINIKSYGVPHIKSVSLIHKVRAVHALLGFSRVKPVAESTDAGFVSVKESKTRVYPAYEVRGEGIFFEIEQADIDTWIKNSPQVTERVKRLSNNYAASFFGQNRQRDITPKFVLLHTLAHLLMKQLSFECGYSIASLAERIYCANEEDGKAMAGIFIYTANGDAEGTFGGLVRQGRADAFPRLFRKAIQSAKTCSNDPICAMSRGQGRDALNLAACHVCALLPETCCEERNGFLDRGLVAGTIEDAAIGFWEMM